MGIARIIIHTSVFGSYVAVVLMALVLLPWLSSVSEKHPSIYCVEKNMHTYVHIHIHRSIQACMHGYTHTYTHIHIHACTHTCMHT